VKLNYGKAARLAVSIFVLGAAASAYADTYTFTFNSNSVASLSPGSMASPSSSLSAANAIAAYMTAELLANGCVGCSVKVTGGVADTTYNGEGYVVGPVNSDHVVTPVTLGNTNGATGNNATPGATDTFIANTDNNSNSTSSEISMVFTGLLITGVSFDYEIFPDGTCSSLRSCGYNDANLPDFEFTAGTKGNDTAVTAFGTNGIQYGVVPGNGDGNQTHSINSGRFSSETAPQYIGVSGPLTLNNATDLNFIDWPATIGIDNLKITYTPTDPVPEPSTVGLILTVGLVCFGLKKKARKA